MTYRALVIAGVLAFASATAAIAQNPQGPPPPQGQDPGGDPIMRNLYPPDLIMRNQEAIRLTDEQRQVIQGEIQRTQTAGQQIQWRLQQAVERLGNTLQQDRAEENIVLGQMDSVLSAEREMKRLQMTLLIRIKSRLTPEQQAFLRGLTAGRGPRED